MMNAGSQYPIGPTGITASYGNLHIEGYPTAKHVYKITTPLAGRLAALRLHGSDLDFCSYTMQKLFALGEPSEKEEDTIIKDREIFLTTVLVKFFGCFSSSEARFKLSEDIYKNTPHAMEAFLFAKNLRNKHTVHDENNCHFSVTCAVLDDKDDLIDILSFKSQFYTDAAFYRNLSNLIQDAQKYVASQIEQALKMLFDEIRAMPATERSAFPNIEHKFPSSADLGKTRNY
jgi:hypothetical protein